MMNNGKMEIQKCIYFTISKMFRMINKMAEESFEKLDIYPTHGFLMIILKEEENGLTVNQISETLAIEDLRGFADKIGKDKKYDQVCEDFDFWII